MGLQRIHLQKKLILVFALVGIIAMFLPWIKIEIFGFSQTINGLHKWGYLIFLCFVTAGALALTGNTTKSLEKLFWLITTGSGAIASLILIISFFRANSGGFNFLTYGFYLTLIAFVGLLLSTVLIKDTTTSEETGNMGDKN